ncbi:MAG: anti-sigma factor [Acidobacteriaceae bacterium]|nr:anti-sigma factor [Acidobacteriaceae bacterium]
MGSDSWFTKIDAYVDAELPTPEMRAMDAHLRDCQTCAGEALRRTALKRSIRSAGKQFAPSPELRRKIQAQIAKPKRSWQWLLAPSLAFAAVVVVAAILGAGYWFRQQQRTQLVAQISDQHVADLASSNPVDVISTDRHTVKPWFQGKLPFSFNLPEFQGTQFVLVGGRVTYLDHAPGAHLIVDVRKHHMSVFIFQENPRLAQVVGSREFWAKPASFNEITWAEDGLRYFIVSDASADDLRSLSDLLKRAAKSPA